ncbi:MAG: hypothetical protein DRJ42_03220 [Deltaproteobacteria bacterium]|nr:MAG: hypothetical protein DRJ42_03220 [Deltaproteobacteria bacterium]
MIFSGTGVGMALVGGRGRAIAILLLALSPFSTAQAQTWTEADVLAMVLEGAPDVRVAEGRIAQAEALADAVGLYPDPMLRWDREAVATGVGSSQDVVALTVPVDLSGRRSAQHALADARIAQREAEAIDARSRIAAAALTAFYEGIASDERVEVALRAVAALDEAVRVITAREAQGTAAGMDQMRVTLEVELARSVLATSEISAKLARARLLVLLGRPVDDEPTLDGTLAVSVLPELAAVLDEAEEQPTLATRRRARELASDATSSAASAWIPPLLLTGGVNLDRETNTEVGYVAGVSFLLPFFSQGRAVSAAARGQSAVAEAELDARTRRARAAVVAAHIRLVGLYAEANRFDAETRGSLEGLLLAANSGYREGRRTLVELLDARRAAISVALRRVNLRLEARRAEIALRNATGALR